MIEISNTQLVIIDIQGKLSQIVHESENFLKNCRILVQGCKLMEIPIVWVEQTPDKLGKTHSTISELLTDNQPITKTTFSAWGSDEFKKALSENGRNQILLIGIESHICVYQTAIDLLANGYNVKVISDAVSSRTHHNKQLGISMIEKHGGYVASTESILFQLMKTSEFPLFRDIVKLVR